MKKLTIGIIGCGTIANLQHLPQTALNDTVTVKYACDIIADRAKAASEKFGIEIACEDYQTVLADPAVDAVLVLTPNYSHYTIAMDALKKGKHVFVEKPVTVNYALSKEMADEAEKQKRMLDIGVCNRSNRSVERIKKRIEAGELGNVYHTYVSFRAFRSIPGLGGDFTTKAKAGGGALIDWGVHLIDLTLYAAGLPKVKTVSASAYNALGRDMKSYVFNNMWAGPPKYDGVCDVDDFVTGFIRTEGTSMSFNGAWAQNIDKEEMFIDFLGDKAGIRLDYGGGFTQYGARGGELYTEKPSFTIPNMYFTEESEFFDSIRTGKKTHNNIVYVLETMRILQAIYDSAETGKEIAL